MVIYRTKIWMCFIIIKTWRLKKKNEKKHKDILNLKKKMKKGMPSGHPVR